jgi:hypothetical protein
MQAAVIQNHKNVNFRNKGQGEAQHRKHIKGSNLVVLRHTTIQGKVKTVKLSL